MEITSILPRTRRNRIAMSLGLLCLALLLAWNFTTFDRQGPYGVTEPTTMAKSIWPNLAENLLSIDATRLSFEDILGVMTILLLCLLALLSFVIVPAWKLWQASAVLRIIPASLMLLGFLVLSVLIILQPPSNDSRLFVLLTMAANFLMAALSLFLFKNESIEHPDHGISST